MTYFRTQHLRENILLNVAKFHLQTTEGSQGTEMFIHSVFSTATVLNPCIVFLEINLDICTVVDNFHVFDLPRAKLRTRRPCKGKNEIPSFNMKHKK